MSSLSLKWGLPLLTLALFSCQQEGQAGCSSPRTGAEKAPQTAPSTEDPALPGVTRASKKLMNELQLAYQKLGPDYRPRTHHLLADGSPEFINRLIFETSPYLLQHAHNPVNWRAWNEEAFARAQAENKPILLSIGYSTCHWCHVMERESFEDKEIAAFINEHFIAIKVDREERPDIDDVYMSAVQLMTGRGGWPMTIIMTPHQEPFFAGTYLPARDGDRGSSQGFFTLLKRTQAVYQENPTALISEAQQISQKVMAAAAPQKAGNIPGQSLLDQSAALYVQRFDPNWGGFGRAPKFPRPSNLDFLLRYQKANKSAKKHLSEDVLQAALLTLDKMADGGMFDQVGGGFHRYSTDSRWLVPHFEKMLYDNAQLVSSYLDAYQISGEQKYAHIARRTLDYALREMRSATGTFYSATDADSLTASGEMEEGYYFTWTPSELEALLSEDEVKAVSSFYGVSPQGNFEGRSIFHVTRPLAEVATELKLKPEQLQALLESARQKLYSARAKRPAPGLDDKILTAWNALMISALYRAAFILDDKEYELAAEKSLNALLKNVLLPEAHLHRISRHTSSKQAAFLDDYAFLIEALLYGFQVTAAPERLQLAQQLSERLQADFWDHKQGAFFTTGKNHEQLLARDKPSYDGAEPSGNSVMACNLLRLNNLFGEQKYREQAEQIFQALSSEMSMGMAAPRLLAALQDYYQTPLQVIAVLADNTDQKANSREMLQLVRSSYLPQAVTLLLTNSQAQALETQLPFLEGKRSKDTLTVYVCERGSCKLPARDSNTLAQQLAEFQ